MKNNQKNSLKKVIFSRIFAFILVATFITPQTLFISASTAHADEEKVSISSEHADSDSEKISHTITNDSDSTSHSSLSSSVEKNTDFPSLSITDTSSKKPDPKDKINGSALSEKKKTVGSSKARIQSVSKTKKTDIKIPEIDLGTGGSTSTGAIRVCKMIVDENNNIATSSVGLPHGVFRVDLSTATTTIESPIASVTFNTETFTPNTRFILDPSLGQNDAQCIMVTGLPINTPPSIYYGRESVSPSSGSPWAQFAPLYNDQWTVPVNDLTDFFVYTPQRFDNDPSNDTLINDNSDGHVTLQSQPRTIVILNRYRTPVNTPPTITLVGANPMTIERFSTFVDPGATAFDLEDGDLTSAIVSTGNVNANVLGSYLREYSVTDSGGLTATTSRVVNVIRGDGPEENNGTIKVCKMIVDENNNIATSSVGLPQGNFRINFSTSSSTPIGNPLLATVDFSATSFSPTDSFILGENDAQCVTLTGLPINPPSIYYSEELISVPPTMQNTWGTPLYNDQYTVQVDDLTDLFAYTPQRFDNDPSNDTLINDNSDGHIALAPSRRNRTLVILNKHTGNGGPINTPPTITLIGENPLTVQQDTVFVDPGATAFDLEDGDLTSAIVSTSTVDTTRLGSYTIDYSVTDSGGLSATTSRVVVVENDNGGGGGGGSSGGRRSTPAPHACSYLEDYLRIDWNNDPVEVLKMQLFLKNFEGFTDLPITGVFDQATFDATSAFQNRYFDDILRPWGHEAPTGFVYILTKKKVNEIYCQTVYPLTSQQSQEITEFRAFLESLKARGASPEEIQQIDFSELIGSNATSTDIAQGISTSTIGQITENVDGSRENSLRKVAAVLFSIPKNFGELVQSIYLLLIAIVAIYLLTEIFLGSRDLTRLSRKQIRSQRYMAYILGLILAALIGAWYEAYTIIIPLIILAIVSGVMLVWNMTRRPEEITAQLPPPSDQNKTL